MELIEGKSLRDLGRREPGEALRIIGAVAEALRYAHDVAKVVHRDIKPSNVMISADGTVRVIDFGLGVFIEQELVSRLTQTGKSIVGGHYTAPELVQDPKLIDPRTDVYAIGALWFELLVGRPPAGSNIGADLEANVKVSPEYRNTLLKCLDRAEARFQSCAELLNALESVR